MGEEIRYCDLCQREDVEASYYVLREEFDSVMKGMVVIEREGDIVLCEDCLKVYERMRGEGV